MPKIVIETIIHAAPEVCFDLMRDSRVHRGTKLSLNGEAAVHMGQKVTFESKFIAVSQRLTVEVVECRRPQIFVDEMVDGPFASFRHVHEFEEINDSTRLTDTLTWKLRRNPFGKLADKVLEYRFTSIVRERNEQLKRLSKDTRER